MLFRPDYGAKRVQLTCGLEGCTEPQFSACKGERGGAVYHVPLCKRHYSKLSRRGDPTLGRAKRKDAGKPRFRVGGERYHHHNGYMILYYPEHPNANKYGYVKEHTYVMSQHLGRGLYKGESVHHLNGVRDDNRVENLELWTVPPRKNVRVKDAIKDCIEFLAKYGIRTCE